MNEVIYRPLSSGQEFKVQFSDHQCVVKTQDDQSLKIEVKVEGSTLHLNDMTSNSTHFSLHLMIALEYLLGHDLSLQKIHINTHANLEHPFELLGKDFERSQFFQLPHLWHHRGNYIITPEKWTETNGRRHPIRPSHHRGEVYKRYIPLLGKTITYRLIDADRDLDTFHEWHNQSRVSFFWELDKPRDELKTYIENGLKNPHQVPLMVEIDGDPVGYYEMYWVQEDRLGPYYESEAYDRGFHFLIGNKNYLGHKITDSIIKCGLHFMYLDEARTRRIMAEPRHDNQKVLKYAEASIGWRKVKIFDFPHKRAWLLENSREVFFDGNAL